MSPLPSISHAVSLLCQDERQRGLTSANVLPASLHDSSTALFSKGQPR